MRHSFNPFARSLAGLACCMALGLTASACVAARGAVVASTPNPQALDRWLSSELIIDWNIDCFTGRGPVVENQSREPMPALRPGADLTDEPAPVADEAAAGNDAASSPAADTSAAEDSDDMKYKSFSNTEDKEGDAVKPADVPRDNGRAAEAKVGDVATESDRADADETDPTPATGNNAMDGSDEGSDVADGAAKTVGANDEQSPGDAAGDDCFRMTLAEAFAAVISNYADELAARYGVATSGVARLLGWEW